MNEKIFKTLGQIGASGIVVGIITVIVGVTALAWFLLSVEHVP